MRALEKLRVYLAGEGKRWIKPPRIAIGGFDDWLRIEPRPPRKRRSNVVPIQKAVEK